MLAGGGHAHLSVLADWAARPLPDTERLLITSSRHTVYSGMVPGWLAGIYQANDPLIDLAPLAEQAGAQLILADVIGLDAAAKVLTLSTGDNFSFDWLSLAIGGEIDTAALAAAGDRVLPIRPMHEFMIRWAQLMQPDNPSRLEHIAVVGGGPAGIELALNIDAAMRAGTGGARVTLVSTSEGFLHGHAEQVRLLARQTLLERGIAVQSARAAGHEQGLLLSNGAFLQCDCIVAATGSRAPQWLARSGLACTAEGFVAVGADLASTSHPAIFAAGDIIDRADRRLERSGVHAVKAGPVLAANLRAALRRAPMRQYQPRKRTLYLLATGDRRAIMSWGSLAGMGQWAWRIKDWIDRGFVRRYTSGFTQRKR